MIVSAIALAAAGTSAAAVVAAGLAMVAPRCRAWGPVIYRGTGPGRRVALTFDDGPTPGATDDVLDILSQHDVPAAFFVVGQSALRWPELLRRIHMAGHLVANHSFSHSHYGFLRPAGYWRSELALTDNAIEDVIGRRPAMFRPPMGVKSPAIASEAARAGHAVVTWTQRGRDGVRTSVAGLEARLLARVGPGDVLLLHDGIEPNGRRDPSVTLRALPRIIRELRARDLEPVRLDELLDIPAYQTAPVTSRRIRACA